MDVLKQLHTSVAQTFENCFDNAYRDLRAEIAAYDTRVKDAEKKAKIAEKARHDMESEVRILKDEISLLREELRQNETDSKDGGFTTETSRQLEEVYDPRRVFGDDNANTEGMKTISDRYTELYEQVGILVRASAELRRQVKRHKKKLAQWRNGLQREEFALLVEGDIVRFRRVKTTDVNNRGEPSPDSTTPMARQLEGAGRDLDANVSSSRLITPGSEIDHDQTWSSTADESENGTEKQLQGSRPELVSTPSDTSATELPPNIPAISSTQRGQILKRKRYTLDQIAPNNSSSGSSKSGGPDHPIMVKTETMSSSPLRNYSLQDVPTGTQDLDNIGNTVATPTKKVRLYRDQDIQPEADFPGTTGSPSAQHKINQGNVSGRNRSISKGTYVLQPVDCNIRNPSCPSRASNRIKRRDFGSKSRISMIAEDDDENYPRTFMREKAAGTPQRESNARNGSGDQRLLDLLDKPSPSSRLLQSRGHIDSTMANQSRTRHSYARDSSLSRHTQPDTATNILATTLEPRRDNLRLNVQENNADKLAENLGPIEMSPDDEPYRARPIHRLGLEHFKINPDYNHGLDFAYDEVVRKKDERKCVSGCTRPGCCGEKFRAMVRFGIPTDVTGKGMGDQEILEEYLGEEKHLIHGLSPEERKGLVEEAKTRIFSDRFGRHRHQHHRPGTPPGFWRTDMPGTQELEEDREEARRMEREKVKERYREAMRPGGRWKFADE